MFAALAKRWNYSVENAGEGRLLYREGNREYTFPLYEENGVWVLVSVPSAQRIHFFFSWHWHPQEFNAKTGERILPRIAEHLRAGGAEVRIFERAGQAEEEFEFYPELFEHRGRATELLDEGGLTWFTDYSSIDLLHADYGLEVCGIKSQRDARRVAMALQRGFPHWHHQNVCLHDSGREPGWAVALCMFPSRSCNPECCDGD